VGGIANGVGVPGGAYGLGLPGDPFGDYDGGKGHAGCCRGVGWISLFVECENGILESVLARKHHSATPYTTLRVMMGSVETAESLAVLERTRIRLCSSANGSKCL